MDSNSINTLLKYFPYTESEKALLHELIINRDPFLMSALNNFITTRNVNTLESAFKAILSQQGPSTGSAKDELKKNEETKK